MLDSLKAVEAALQDWDGSTRDLNFDSATWEGVSGLVRDFNPEFASARVGCSSADTTELQIDDVDEALRGVQRNGGSAQILLDGGTGFVRHLQIFVSASTASSPNVELTFFPPDVRQVPNVGACFVEWACRARAILGASAVYARYENASWVLGDVAPESGVFFYSEEA
jgi:hypothetical protein